MREFFQFLAAMPPEPGMSLDLWLGFRQEIIGWFLGSVLVGAAGIVGVYSWSSRQLTVREPGDPFRPFTPIRWLWFSVIPGFVVVLVYLIRYGAIFPFARISAVGGSVTAGLAAALFTYLVAQVATWLPGVTPLKFIYHPRWPWRLFRRRAA